MGKQTRAKKSGSPSSSLCLGKGKVTPRQIAFIVDRYLCDNSFAETRSVFRNEASSFIPNSPAQEAPRNLLTLEAILDEYICLKEQKVMVEEERARVDFEKLRVHSLLHSMQDVLNAYNSAATTPAAPVPPPAPVAASSLAPVPQLMPYTSSPPGGPAHVSPGVLPVSTPSNASLKQVIVSTPISTGPSTRKRAGSSAVYQALPDNKRSRSKPSLKRMPSDVAVTSNQHGGLAEVAASLSCINGQLFQGSSVAKSLFNQPLIAPPSGLVVPLPSGSTVPNTPPQIVSAQEEKSVSPRNMASGANSCSSNSTPQDVTPTSCTVITSERVTVSPCKNPGYYTVERNQCIATSSPVKTTFTRFSKRDCVKSRLDFDGSDVTRVPAKPSTEDASTSESDKDSDPFEIDFPNLEMFGPDFCFSELLVDLDLGADIGFTCQQNLPAPVDTPSGSSPGCSDENLDTENVTSEFSSTVTHVISEKDAIVQGADNLTAMRSVTKCIILSPAKNRKNSLN